MILIKPASSEYKNPSLSDAYFMLTGNLQPQTRFVGLGLYSLELLHVFLAPG